MLADTRYKIQDTRYKIQDTRYKIQDTRYKIQDTRYKIQDTRDYKDFRLIVKKFSQIFSFLTKFINIFYFTRVNNRFYGFIN